LQVRLLVVYNFTTISFALQVHILCWLATLCG